jgi:hypothetical protein
MDNIAVEGHVLQWPKKTAAREEVTQRQLSKRSKPENVLPAMMLCSRFHDPLEGCQPCEACFTEDCLNDSADVGAGEAHMLKSVVLQEIQEKGSDTRYRRLFATSGPYLQKAAMYPDMIPIVQRQGIVKYRRSNGTPANWR